MKRQRKIVILSASALAAAVTLLRGQNVYTVNVVNGPRFPPSADLTGEWKSEFDATVGHLKYTYNLKVDGFNLTGKAIRISDTDTNSTELVGCLADRDSVTFIENLKINDQELQISYSGQLSATNRNELDLTRVVGDLGSNNIVLTRQTAATVTGKWDAEFDSQIGHLKYVFDLTQDGGKLTGKAIRNQDDQKTETVITNGTVAGDEITFTEPLVVQDQAINISYTGKVTGTTIQFNRMVADFATNQIIATRESVAK